MKNNQADVRTNSPDSNLPHRYRCGSVVRFAMGDGQELVFCRNNASVALIPSGVAALLGHCGKFRTLDEHVSNLCAGKDITQEIRFDLKSRLQEMVDRGLFISENHLCSLVAEHAAEELPRVRIRSVCIPTSKRPEALKKALNSYIANCRRYGKDNDFVVMDDSQSPDVRVQNKEVLETLKLEHAAELSYAGSDEKREFLNRLVEAKDLPGEVVTFALFGDDQSGLATYGANQNAILLHTVGDAIFCADDDTVCRIAQLPATKGGLSAISRALDTRDYPERVLLFSDRESLYNAADFVDTSLIDMHEQFLGREPGALISECAAEHPVDLSRTDVQFAKMLAEKRGRIRVTLNGLIGDCCETRPSYYLFLEGSSFDKLTETETEYRILRTSRECFKTVEQAVIRDNLLLQSTFLGLDNRELLPPFLPVGSGQDTLFGHVLSKCFTDNLYTCLPWALLHEPAEERRFSPDEIFESRPAIGGITSLIGLVLRSLQLGKWTASPAARLRILGTYLEEVGSMPLSEFREMLSLLVWQAASAEISRLETAIQKAVNSRQYWIEDVRIYLKNRRNQLLDENVWLPYDLLEDREAAEAAEITQKLVRQFGSLLKWWPDIVSGARRLRESGYRLAKQL